MYIVATFVYLKILNNLIIYKISNDFGKESALSQRRATATVKQPKRKFRNCFGSGE